MKCIIIGHTGLLGGAFKRILGDDAITFAREEWDIKGLLSDTHPLRITDANVVINCAANVDAEGAEVDPEPAYKMNIIFPRLIAQICQQSNKKLVHFSSTGAYGNWKKVAYNDWDDLQPTTAHHQTKKQGEDAVRQSNISALILRVGWLYGGHSHNKKDFVSLIKNEIDTLSVLQSNKDQWGCPTFVDDVVRQTVLLLENNIIGTLNCVAVGEARRLDYVRTIVDAFEADIKVHGVDSKDFNRKAKVSPNEMAKNKVLDTLKLNIMPSWREALINHIKDIRE